MPLDVELRGSKPRQRHSPTGDRCGYRRADGSTCRNSAGYRTDHLGFGKCRRHGGCSPNHRKPAQQLIAEAAIERAKEAVAALGLARDIGPQAALLEELKRTAGHVAWLGEQIAELPPAALVWGATERKLTAVEGPSDGPSPEGSRGARLVEAKEGPSVSSWMELYQRERKHLVDVCRVAISCGIAERQVQIAEEQGRIIALVIRGVLSDFGLDQDAEDVRKAVRSHLVMVAAAEVRKQRRRTAAGGLRGTGEGKKGKKGKKG